MAGLGGSQHATLCAALAAGGRAVEVTVVGRDAEDAATEMAAIKKATATGDSTAQAYGGLNPALRRTRILNAACVGSR